jgi:hypothetical protein
MALNQVTLTLDAYNGADVAVGAGTAYLTPSAAVAFPSDQTYLWQVPIEVSLVPPEGASDAWLPTVTLISNDNSGGNPSTWYWVISYQSPGAPPGFTFALDYSNGASQNLSAQVPVQSSQAGFAYLPLPTGTPTAGQVPVVQTNGVAQTAWGSGGGGGSYVPLAGGNMTGALTISESGASGGLLVVTNTHSTPSAPSIQLVSHAAADIALGLDVSGDADYRFEIDSNGKMYWGSGSAASDVSLARNSSGLLQVGGALKATGGAAAGSVFTVQNTTSSPTSPNAIVVAAAAADSSFGIEVSGDADFRFTVDSNGKHSWGSGSAVADTTLSRSAAGILSVGSALSVTGLTGATSASRLIGATASGAPASGTFAIGDVNIDQTGTLEICTSAGSPGNWAALLGAYSFPTISQLGILAQNYPSLLASVASAALTSGLIYLLRINLSGASITVTNVLLGVYTAGSSLTLNECWCGLYDNNGNEIGISANQSSNWTTAGLKSMALAGGPFTGTWPFVDVAVLSNGSTNPIFARASGGGVGVAMANLNATGAGLMCSVNGTGATVLPGSFTYSSNSTANNPQSIWCGVS